MRIVLDTNVVVAAFAARGLCAEVFEVSLAGHTLILSEHILLEVKVALLNKVKLPKQIVHEVVNYLRDSGEIVEPAAVDSSICRDKTDLPVLGTAISGKAVFIVTGDADLLAVKNCRGIEIITPREFWSRLK
ncbi:MAG: putative toxin-antitoxin system toxin component, PIN family [Nitrospiraceae bacterium]|nr:putative toxin-antitoxin system toxin component, PIN family [Nitrospiraceae bacterium]